MITCVFEPDKGWQTPVLRTFEPLSMSPASSVLHYGQAIFEGMKAYRQQSGTIALFRPRMNARRFSVSAERIAMPPLPEHLFMACIEALVREEKEWVSSERGEALYVRPFMVATDGHLGVRPSGTYLFCAFCSPAGSYFASGVKPVTVGIAEEYIRAAQGGTGDAKFAGNYAASLLAQRRAAENGCDQVVWLDAKDRSTVEEMGGMNIFFVYDEDGRTILRTPPLGGTILPGITRDSILKLGSQLGFEVQERAITVDAWRAAALDKTMTETFACGTAAVITPVGTVKTSNATWTINEGKPGPIAEKIRKYLLDIQYGVVEDEHEWCHPIV